MVTEDYISFETAKLLKEKGFDEYCPKSYFKMDKTLKKSGFSEWEKVNEIKAPTQSLAMKWLREVHTIDIVITPSMFRRKYNVCIYKDENLCCVDFDGVTLSPSYEYACEASIKYCLEHLI
jgi:hypothetical protein